MRLNEASKILPVVYQDGNTHCDTLGHFIGSGGKVTGSELVSLVNTIGQVGTGEVFPLVVF